MSEDSDTDFQPPGRPRFGERLESITSTLSTNNDTVSANLPGGSRLALQELLHRATGSIQQAVQESRSTRRRGPSRTAVRLRFYLLPSESRVPKIKGSNRDNELIEMHHSVGYGFPVGVDRAVSLPLKSSEEDVQQALQDLFPNKPAGASFSLNKMDKRKLIPIQEPLESLYGFKGVVWLKLEGLTGNRPALAAAAAVQQQQEPQVANIQRQQHGQSREVDRPLDTTVTPLPGILPSDIPPSPPLPEDILEDTPPSLPLPDVVVEDTPPSQPLQDVVVEDTPPSPPLDLERPETPMSPLILPVSPNSEEEENRRNLREEQDLEYSASLATDMARTRPQQEIALARVQRRDVRRQESQRRRELLAGLDPEPGEGDGVITAAIRLPLRTLERRFQLSTSCSEIYQFVRGSTLRATDHLLVGREHLPDDTTTLSQAGITTNFTAHAQFAAESDDTDGSDAEPEVPSSIALNSLSDLVERAASVNERLRPAVNVTVRRSSVVEDLLEHYQDREVVDLVHRQVNFSFDGEPAIDVGGVTREVFTLFFTMLFSTTYFSGNAEVIPLLDHRVLFTGFYETIGRIIAHAYVLVGYFPVRLCKASVMYILSGKCPASIVRDSFLKSLPDSESKIVQQLLNGAVLNRAEKDSLIRCLSAVGCMKAPTSENIFQLVSELAHFNLICKPSFALGQLLKGLSCYPLLWQGMETNILNALYTHLKPNVEAVLRRIKVEFSGGDTPDQNQITRRGLEESTKEYLERYISGLSDKDLAVLLKFWTGSDVLIVYELRLSFNSQEGIARRPLSNICISQLTLSRYFFSYEDFSKELTVYLNHPVTERFDSV